MCIARTTASLLNTSFIAFAVATSFIVFRMVAFVGWKWKCVCSSDPSHNFAFSILFGGGLSKILHVEDSIDKIVSFRWLE